MKAQKLLQGKHVQFMFAVYELIIVVATEQLTTDVVTITCSLSPSRQTTHAQTVFPAVDTIAGSGSDDNV